MIFRHEPMLNVENLWSENIIGWALKSVKYREHSQLYTAKISSEDLHEINTQLFLDLWWPYIPVNPL
jgi:hypothetical protein